MDLLPQRASLADTLSVKGGNGHCGERLPRSSSPISDSDVRFLTGDAGAAGGGHALHDGFLVDNLLARIEAGGGRVVRMDAVRHDRLVAVSQALTHATLLAFGHALHTLDANIDEPIAIAPPPHATRWPCWPASPPVPPEVYWDIQSGKLLATDVHEELTSGWNACGISSKAVTTRNAYGC